MKKLLVLLMLMCVASAGSAQAQELIQGGSFEYWPEVFELHNHLNVGDWIGGAVDEWEVDLIAEPGFGVIGLPDGWTASPVSDGYWNLHLADGGRVAGIRQSITTVPNTTYDFSFWHEDFGHDQLAQMLVQIGDAAGSGDEYLSQVFSTTTPVYQVASFTATAANSVIRFESVEFGNTIDEVTIEPVFPITVTHSDGQSVVAEENETTDSFTIVLDQAPTGAVTVTLDPQTADVELNGAGPNNPVTLAFGTADWDTPQTVTVKANDDAEAEAEEWVPIAVTLVSTDPSFVGTFQTSVTIIDNDSASVIIEQSDGSTDVVEGGTSDTYTVVLGFPPTADVTVTVDDLGDPNQTLLNGGETVELTFTPANWNTPQAVTVMAIDDSEAEVHPHTTTLTHAISSGDENYAGLTVEDVSAAVGENDCGAGPFAAADFDKDCKVGLADYAAIAAKWLNCSITSCL